MIPRKTKIICTIGPATSSLEKLTSLINKGMDVARLNFSHGSHDEHLELIKNIREASKIAGKNIPIMQDLQGPKIRTGKLKDGKAELKDGEEFIITADEIEEGDATRVGSTYPEIVKDVKKGTVLLLDDGYITLEITKIDGNNIHTKVVNGGILKNNKGIVALGLTFSAPTLSDKDLEDLKFGLESGVDVIALSFIRNVKDIYELKTAMKIFGRTTGIVAKIELPDAVENIDEIIQEADGVMVARGDLGLEMPPEELPLLQKDIIRRCNYYGKPAITATQMLESMISNPRPTRAEASDVANAVIDGSDAVMLSGETSIGKHPFAAVEYMSKIVKRVEDNQYAKNMIRQIDVFRDDDAFDAMGNASCQIADQINAAAIVTLTSSTFTAKNIAKFRPRIPIIGVADDEVIQRRLNFVWGVTSILIPKVSSDVYFEHLRDQIIEFDYIKEGDMIVFVAGLSPDFVKTDNVIRIYKI
jgi:pyruvate kinase